MQAIPPPPPPPPPHPTIPAQNNAAPPSAIHYAADELLHVFSEELEHRLSHERKLMHQQFSWEREKLYHGIQLEREALEREKMELHWDREQVQKERKMMIRCEVAERELREENEALRNILAHLREALDSMQGRSAYQGHY